MRRPIGFPVVASSFTFARAPRREMRRWDEKTEVPDALNREPLNVASLYVRPADDERSGPLLHVRDDDSTLTPNTLHFSKRGAPVAAELLLQRGDFL